MKLTMFCLLIGLGACSKPNLVPIPYQQDFSSKRLGPEWSSTGGGWAVVDGRLFNDGARNVPLWLSASLPKDVVVELEAESKSDAVDIKFEIFYGASDNAAAWWDNSNARKFGYKPTGKAEEHRAQAMEAQKALPPDPVGDRYQGGPFCSDEYDADKRG